MHTAVVYVR